MKQNKKHGTAALIILALIALIIVPVSAETLTGTLGSTTATQKNMTNTGTFCGGIYQTTFVNLRVADLENVGGTLALIHEDEAGKYVSINSGAPSSDTAPFVGHLDTAGGVHIVTGTFGYARRFNALGVEQPGYQWLQFNNDWNLTGAGKTGDHAIYIEFTNTWGVHYECAAFVAWDHNTMAWNDDVQTGGWMTAGQNRITVSQSTLSEYTATKPSGLGIAGVVGKTIGGTPYLSKIFIEDSSGNIVTSDSVSNSNNFTFNVDETQIYIKMLSGFGTWYNSSILFAPTVTPTPTTTWTDTDPIPAGYVRTWFNAVDGTAGSVIYGAALKLKDVQNGSWKNNTAGYSYIDTLPGHTIDAYGTMTGYTGDTRLGLPAVDTVYELTLWSGLIPPATGKVNLIILVTDETTGQTISGATVTARLTTSATWGGVTGSAGTSIFEVPNMTYVIGTASKPGYESRTAAITTTAFGPDTLRIAIPLSRVTVTATATPLSGQLTVAPTIDANDPSRNGGDTSLKAQEMMNWLAMNGMDLVQLCFLVTVLALLGVKFGK